MKTFSPLFHLTDRMRLPWSPLCLLRFFALSSPSLWAHPVMHNGLASFELWRLIWKSFFHPMLLRMCSGYCNITRIPLVDIMGRETIVLLNLWMLVVKPTVDRDNLLMKLDVVLQLLLIQRANVLISFSIRLFLLSFLFSLRRKSNLDQFEPRPPLQWGQRVSFIPCSLSRLTFFTFQVVLRCSVCPLLTVCVETDSACALGPIHGFSSSIIHFS